MDVLHPSMKWNGQRESISDDFQYFSSTSQSSRDFLDSSKGSGTKTIYRNVKRSLPILPFLPLLHVTKNKQDRWERLHV